ncbi:MAG: PEP-CTERM sorting domain-containing protein [Phycisphaerales bacterium]|nr:PEP-CTERM sorting domain-containing protein [Phycisphaerales bacterium]
MLKFNDYKYACLLTFAGILIMLAGAPAQAGIQTQVIPFSHDEGEGFPFFTIDYFDTMGGARTLTGVTIDLAATSTLEVTTENLGNQPINNWNFNFGVLPSMEILDFKKLAFFFDPVDYPTVVLNLAPNDGTPGSGPDFALIPERTVDIMDTINVGPGDVPSFIGSGSVDAFLGLPFLFPFPPGPTDTNWIRNETGTLTVTYEYVPEPSSLALMCVCGAFICGRRRRAQRLG